MSGNFRGLSRGRKECEILISWPRWHQQKHSCYVTRKRRDNYMGLESSSSWLGCRHSPAGNKQVKNTSCIRWLLPISSKMTACMGPFLWEHYSLYSQEHTSGVNQRKFLNKFCYIESMNEKWLVLNVITIQLYLDANISSQMQYWTERITTYWLPFSKYLVLKHKKWQEWK